MHGLAIFLYSQLFVTPPVPTHSFAGQTVIITGSNTGLGREAARHIARLGVAKLILAVRNITAGEEARKDIEGSTSCDPSTIEVWPLDLSSYESIRSFAERASKLQRIDVLLENAGIQTQRFSLAGGHESTITVNVIGTFLLALLLLPKLKQDAKQFSIRPRISIVTSETHGMISFPERKAADTFAELSNEKTADMGNRYPTSKLLEVLVVRQIAPQLKDAGVTVNLVNPGWCYSSLMRDFDPLIARVVKRLIGRTAEVGSRNLVAGAAAGEESHGKYMSDSVIAEDSLSVWVRTDEAALAGHKVWNELSAILEDIVPGVTKDI